MSDKDGGDARLPLDAADLLPGLQAQPGIQVGERLVQKQDPGHLHQRPGNCHALLLAAGELRGLSIHQAVDLHQTSGLLGPLLHLLLAWAIRAPQILQGEEDILPHGQMGIQGIVLEHQANAAILRRQAGHIIIPKEDLSGGGCLQTADQIQGGGFAAARGAQQANELPIRDLKAEVVDGDHVARLLLAPLGEHLGQLLQSDFHMHPSSLAKRAKNC